MYGELLTERPRQAAKKGKPSQPLRARPAPSGRSTGRQKKKSRSQKTPGRLRTISQKKVHGMRAVRDPEARPTASMTPRKNEATEEMRARSTVIQTPVRRMDG